jgi:hypothetical protein
MDHKRVKPKDKRDRYLILDPCGVYMVRIAVPAYMAAHFGNKTYFMRSTATRDIRQARLFRDAIALEWYKLRDQLKPDVQVHGLSRSLMNFEASANTQRRRQR